MFTKYCGKSQENNDIKTINTHVSAKGGIFNFTDIPFLVNKSTQFPFGILANIKVLFLIYMIVEHRVTA